MNVLADLPPAVRQACLLLAADPASGVPDRSGWTMAGEELARRSSGGGHVVPALYGEQRMEAEGAVARARQILHEHPGLRRSLRETPR